MPVNRIVLWQNMLSIQQSALVSALAGRVPEVVLVAPEEMPAERRALGWTVPSFGRARIYVAPDGRAVRQLLEHERDRTVHIFSGWNRLPFAMEPIRLARALGIHFGFAAEAPEPTHWRGSAKIVRDRVKQIMLGADVDFVLGMGEFGHSWYIRAGFSPEKVFVFGYFATAEKTNRQALPRQPRPFRIIYVGQLVPRKGCDVLLDALGQIKRQDWECNLFGTGWRRRPLEIQVERHRLESRVIFHGARHNGAVCAAIGESDLLVLPSRWDGWGIVVNEALMRGVPVISTDRCGARELLDGAERGEVVKAGSVSALTSAIERRLTLGPPDDVQRKRVANWAKCLGGASAAQYLLDILAHIYRGGNRPTPPWKIG